MLLRAASQLSPRSVFSLASTSRLTTAPPLRGAPPPCSLHLSAPCRAASSASRDKTLRDENIKAKQIVLVDFETGSLGTRLQSPASILKMLDRQRFWLVQVTEEREVDGKLEAPICKLVDKKAAYDSKRKSKVKAGAAEGGGDEGGVAHASGKAAHKEAVFTWSSTPHDMSHKLQACRQHLHKRGIGARVKITISSKKGKGAQGGSTPQSRAKTLADIEEALSKPMGDDDLVHVKMKLEPEWRLGNSVVVLEYELAKGKPVKF